jgi:hypothetical protein
MLVLCPTSRLEDPCDGSSEHVDIMKLEFIDYLSNCYLLKQDLTPCV